MEHLVSHNIKLIRRPNGKELIIRNGQPYGEEEELLSVSGYSRGDGIFLRINDEETRVEGSFDDVERIVEERFIQENERRESGE